MENQMLYTEAEQPRGRGGRGGPARNSGIQQEHERRHKGGADNNFGPAISRGSLASVGNRQAKNDTECWYYGKKGHKESEC